MVAVGMLQLSQALQARVFKSAYYHDLDLTALFFVVSDNGLDLYVFQVRTSTRFQLLFNMHFPSSLLIRQAQGEEGSEVEHGFVRRRLKDNDELFFCLRRDLIGKRFHQVSVDGVLNEPGA